ncbi:hypothetical protein UA08_07513 [Talaromyces atroroseus]|uniref:Uncharacterized protein n=1 Tax=Talaromyces atroroseus TaxID=1441469 RepID=A0A225AUZ4_TALAT|nr:hypothetical protein UA08_07513 [Talaromyces atroroseus]OKL57297.1 hypothetical protein UA08_07513 [Talaromyces atroroseus]
MQGSIAPAVRASGLCCHCGRGLPYDTYYFWCLFCDLTVCANCPGSHPAVHQPYYKYMLNRTTPRGARPSQSLCTKCRQLSHCGLSCNDCEFNLCVNCMTTSRDTLANHPHGKMTITKAPDDFGLGMYDVQCDSCRAGATLSHCGRCCNVDYNAQIRFCEDCQAPGQREHDPTHRFASFLYRVNTNKDARYNAVKCLDCKSRTSTTSVPFSGRELARHPHSRFQLIMGEAERDRRNFHSHRTCARKPVRDIATVSAEAHDIVCGCCNQKFPMGSRVFMCPTCTMIACETCADFGGARSHPHIMIPVFLQWTVPPVLLGQVRANSIVKACAKCDKSIVPDSDSYIECNYCQVWDICLDCTKKTNMPVRHACLEAVEMTLFDPIKPGHDSLVTQVLAAQKTMTSGVPLQLQPVRQQSLSIRRKPSSNGSSSISSISPISLPVQPQITQTAGMQRRPVISQHGSQLAFNQQSVQLPTGLTSAGLPMQQGVLPSIQPVIQPIASAGEIKRKAIHPAIMDASRSVIDKSNNVSKAAYGKASTMVNDVDKEKLKNMGKSMGKKMARYAGAVTGQIIRQEIQNDTGIRLPPLHLSQNPNQQAQTLHAQMQAQQGKQEIEKLQAQLQLMQKMSQLQSQAALMQQQQQLQHQAVANPTTVTMSPSNPSSSTQLPATAHLTQSISSIQASSSPIAHNQTPSTFSGNSNILHATTAVSTSGAQNPNSSIMASVPPSGVSTPQNGLPITGITHILSNEAVVVPSVHNTNSNDIASIPPSESNTVLHNGNPYTSDIAPNSPSESTTVHSGIIAILNNSSIAPIPVSETDIAPIPLCEQTPPVPSIDSNADSPHAVTFHSTAQSPASTQMMEALSLNIYSSHPVQPQDPQSPVPQQQTHNSGTQGSINDAHSQTAGAHYEHPSVEEDTQSEILQPGSASENQEASNPHVQGSDNLSNVSHSVPQHNHPQPEHPHTEHGSLNTPFNNQPDNQQQQYPPQQDSLGTDPNPSNLHETASSQYNGSSSQHLSADQQYQTTHSNLSSAVTPSQHPYSLLSQPSTQHSPNPHGASTSQHPNTHSQQNLPQNLQASPPSPHTVNEHPSSNNQQCQSHNQGAFQPQHQPSQLPTGNSYPTGGQSNEYHQAHTFNSSATGTGSTYNHASPQQSSSPFQPQSTIPTTTAPTMNASSTQSPPLQSNMPPGGIGQGIPQNPPPAYTQAQTQQPNMTNDQLNLQNQQIMALQQRIQAMNLQQQQQQAQQAQQLQLLSNQLQQQQQNQQGDGALQIVDSGLSILNNLTQMLGNNNNNNSLSVGLNNNNLQQLQLQEQQQELLSLNYLNDLQLQNQLDAEAMVAMNDQMQTNMQLENLNAQLAALNNTQSMDNFNNSAIGMGDVNVNMDIVVDQSFDIQSNAGVIDVTDSSSFFVADSGSF